MKDSEKIEPTGIYSTLLQLPLIKGVSLARLTEMVGRLKLHFFKVANGETVVEQGSECVSLIFVLSGSVRLNMASNDGSFAVAQTLDAPQVILPDCLFGLDTRYPCSVTASASGASLMEISKEDFRRMLALDSVFLFNYLNSVCTGSQRGRHGLMSIAAGSAVERLVYWITTLTRPGSHSIEITSTNREIHSVLGITAAGLRTALEGAKGLATMENAQTLSISNRDSLLLALGE